MRANGRCPGDVTNERDLPEVIAGHQGGYVAPVDEDVSGADVNDVEALARRSLLDDLFARRRGLPQGETREPLDGRFGQRRQERYAPQQLELAGRNLRREIDSPKYPPSG